MTLKLLRPADDTIPVFEFDPASAETLAARWRRNSAPRRTGVRMECADCGSHTVLGQAELGRGTCITCGSHRLSLLAPTAASRSPGER